MSFVVIFLSFAVIAYSDSSYDHNDADKFIDLFVGDYDGNIYGHNVQLSICYRNGNFYGSGRWNTANADYIFIAARGTNGIQTDKQNYNNKLTIKFESAFILILDELLEMTLTLTYKNGKYIIIELDKVEIMKTTDDATICIAPNTNWNDAVYPLNGESPLLPESLCEVEGSKCVEINHHEPSEGEFGRSCWAVYDIDTHAMLTGGIYDLEVRYEWDGELKIVHWTDEGPNAICSQGRLFLLKFDQENGYLAAWKCNSIDPPMIGATYPVHFNCQYTCDLDKELQCPLYQTISRCNDDSNYGVEYE